MNRENKALIGNEKVWAFLAEASNAGHLAPSYMLSGPRHVGRETLVRQFVSHLLCAAADGACGTCSDCKQLARGAHPLLQVLSCKEEPAGIEQVRALRRELGLSRGQGRSSFVLITDISNLSIGAANALLKMLEEPAGGVTFFCLATNSQLVLPTLLSRSQLLNLSRVSDSELEQAIGERYPQRADQARALAEMGEGLPGLALSAVFSKDVLEQWKASSQQALKDIRDAHDSGHLPYSGRRSMSAPQAQERLAGLERAARRLYWDLLWPPGDEAPALGERGTRMLLARIAKAHLIISKNVAPALALDQIYCNA